MNSSRIQATRWRRARSAFHFTLIAICLTFVARSASAGFVDCNSNGTDDSFEISEGSAEDCNANTVPDECDIAEKTSGDCNADGVPDECEVRIFVNADAIGNNDGTSWDDAYNELFDAFTEAHLPGNAGKYIEIWVADGRYEPTDTATRTVSFQLRDCMTVLAGFVGGEMDASLRDPAANVAELSGDLLNNDAGFINNVENSYHVVSANGVDNTAILDGFTISGGNANGSSTNGDGGGMFVVLGAPTISNCNFAVNFAKAGGGMLNDASSPILTDCAFDTNNANNGGGVANRNNSAPEMTRCTFTGNTTPGIGGGMVSDSSSPRLIECTFTLNDAADGGAVRDQTNSDAEYIDCTFTDNSANRGAAVNLFSGSDARMTRCDFQRNIAASRGGGLNSQNSSPVLVNCDFVENEAAPFSADGGAIYFENGAPELTNSLFVGNSAGEDGGAVYNSGADTVVTHCTVVGNIAGALNGGGEGGGFYSRNAGELQINNSILWDNMDAGDFNTENQVFENQDDESAQIHREDLITDLTVIQFSCVMNAVDFLSADVINADPLFADSLSDNFRLLNGSPCIDTGDNGLLPPDGNDIDGDTDVGEPLPLDRDGNPRQQVVLGPDDVAAGVAIVDMGAYELLRDCNTNGIADADDIAEGTSLDCVSGVGNGIPDECESDCHADNPIHPGFGTVDSCDIANGISNDCNANGIPDDCEPDQALVNRFRDGFFTTELDGAEWPLVTGVEVTTVDSLSAPFSIIINHNDVLHTREFNLFSTDDAQLIIHWRSEGTVPGDALEIDYWDPVAGAWQDLIAIAGDSNSLIFDFLTVTIPPAGRVVDAKIRFVGVGGDWFVDDVSVVSTAQDCDNNGTPDDCEDDCNGNGIVDFCDIAFGTSQDCAAEGVPDECEPDCDGNSLADSCDILGGVPDCPGGTGNGIPDIIGQCEPDCDGNNIVDSCDIELGTAEDCPGGAGNGIPDVIDVCESDCDGNNVVDSCDIELGIAQDCNSDGIPDDPCQLDENDCNSDGIPDDCNLVDFDCNNNGIPDDCDIAENTSEDCPGGDGSDGNGIPDECEEDCDGLGVVDTCDIARGDGEDCNSNGILDLCDTDTGASVDCNGNFRPDECEVEGNDCNLNGILDICDVFGATSEDCTFNGVPDECERDCQPNGVADICEIAFGSATDCNFNGFPDGCDIGNGGTLLSVDFEDGLPAGWIQTGLWNITGQCTASGCGPGEQQWAYFGRVGTEEAPLCNFDTGAVELGTLASLAFQMPGAVSSMTLTYCSIFEGDPPIDQAWVAVNGELVDNVALGGNQPIWETRQVDLSAFAGRVVVLSFNFDTLTANNNEFLGWLVDRIEVTYVGVDCLGNGVPDDCDIASPDDGDCNENLIPDSCDSAACPEDESDPSCLDCDTDGVLDGCQVDCDESGIADACEIRTCGVNGPLSCRDCDGNGQLDFCEFDTGDAQDCNCNDIPDICDLEQGTSDDVSPPNLIPDECDNPSLQDTDGDAVLDTCDLCEGFDDSQDTDSDGVPDGCDNCVDDPNPEQKDCNSDGEGDACDTDPMQGDVDTDLVCDPDDNCVFTFNPDQANCNGDAEGDVCDFDPGEQDADSDGSCDNVDTCTDADSDGFGNPGAGFDITGCSGATEDNCPFAANSLQLDCNSDGQGDVCEINVGEKDNDRDGFCNNAETCPNERRLLAPSEPGEELSCEDGIDNDCDGLTDGPDFDCGGICPFTCADINGDSKVDLRDFVEFARCFNQGVFSSQECFCSDMDGSVTVDLQDFTLFAGLFGNSSTNFPPNCP